MQLDPVLFEYFGESARVNSLIKIVDGQLFLNMSGSMPDFDLGRFINRTEEEDLATGKMHVHGSFTTQGNSMNDMLHNLDGEFLITGSELTLKSIDLEQTFDEFNKLKKIGISDVVTLITIGPLFSMFNHAYNQLDVLKKMIEVEGASTIPAIVSKWKVSSGHVNAEDVAFTTKRHRVAVHGSVDFIDEKYVDLTLATVDSDGCLINSETVNGPFDLPKVEDLGLIRRTVILPLKRKFKTGCKLFYEGSLETPHKKGNESISIN